MLRSNTSNKVKTTQLKENENNEVLIIILYTVGVNICEKVHKNFLFPWLASPIPTAITHRMATENFGIEGACQLHRIAPESGMHSQVGLAYSYT